MGEKKEKRKKDKEKRKLTIEDYLKSKDKLLTGFGVFLALTIFSLEFSNLEPLKYLSFLFMSISLLIWFELWTSFPSKNRTWTLIAFENLINISTMLLMVIWFYVYYEMGKSFHVVGVFILIALIYTKLNDKYNIYEKIFKSKFYYSKGFKAFFGLLIIISLWFLAVIITQLFTNDVDSIFKTIKNDIEIVKRGKQSKDSLTKGKIKKEKRVLKEVFVKIDTLPINNSKGLDSVSLQVD